MVGDVRALEAPALETLFQSAPVGMAIIDRAFRYVRVNETLARYNGATPEALAGRTVEHVVPHFWPALKPLFERALAGETITDEEITGRRADAPDQVVYRRFCCSPIRVGPATALSTAPIAGSSGIRSWTPRLD